MSILRVALMCRVSTDEQALHGDSLQAQEESLVQYAEANGMRIFKIYRDEGFSARKPVLKRPAMLELLEDVKSGKIDMILFTKLDRWFRNIQEYYKIQEILDQNKVVWKAILEDYNTATADGRFKVNIMLSVNEQESDRTSERIKFVFNSKIMRKETIFGKNNCPIGYTVAEIDGVKRLVKDEEYREIMEYFFKTACATSIRQAAVETQQKFDIKRDMRVWYKACHNEIYKGTYKGVEDYCEPYVTEAQYNELVHYTYTRKAKNNRVYLFAGLITCPLCGNKMNGKYTVIKSPDDDSKRERFYYRCRNRFSKQCSVKSIVESRVEKYVLENIKSELEKFILSCEVSQPTTPKKKTDPAKFKEQLRRLNVAYQAGNIEDEDYLSKAKEIKALIDKAVKEESEEKKVDTKALKDFLDSDFESIYDSLEQAEKQRLWRSVIDRLVYDGKTVVGIKFKV